MKNKILIIATSTIFIVGYLVWPIYQGLAFKDMVPMLIKPSLTLPEEQPLKSLVFKSEYQDASEAAINALIEQTNLIQAPGYTAAVAINGELIWSGSVGWADIENYIAMTPYTKLRIGSTSKALTSVGLAKLVDSGKIDLDIPMAEYIDELANPIWNKITARHLASHTAGLPHYGSNTEVFGKIATITSNQHYSNVDDAVSLFDESDMLFKPGENFSYSSLGTVLLSSLMQHVAGSSYQNFMFKEVIKPLKMNNTTYESPTKITENLAQFYWRDHSQPYFYKPWMTVDLSHRLAAGGWVSTSQDLVKLGQAFINDNFINPETRLTFWTPQKLTNGGVNPQGYGIGWRIHNLDLGEDFEPMLYVHHGGVSAGAQSFLMVIPKYKLSIAINANVKTKRFSEFNSVSYDLAKLFLKKILDKK